MVDIELRANISLPYYTRGAFWADSIGIEKLRSGRGWYGGEGVVEEGELGDGMGEGRGVAQDQGQFI